MGEWKWNGYMFVFLCVLLSPIVSLFFFGGSQESLDRDLFAMAKANTFLLALAVPLGSTFLGVFFAWVQSAFYFPMQKYLHALIILPLAFPSYVLAFIYLGLLGPSSSFSEKTGLEIQGELFFLVIILILAFTPYIYFFSFLGFRQIARSEVETEMILQGGQWRFFMSVIFPKVFSFLLSAQILVLFESLSDFGAASVINVPVITTMIYKLWFDLFSFSSAVNLSLKYCLIILLILLIEFVWKKKEGEFPHTQRDPVKRKSMPLWVKIFFPLVFLYLLIAFFIPFVQMLIWSLNSIDLKFSREIFLSLVKTFVLGLLVGFFILLISLVIQLLLFVNKRKNQMWNFFSTIGYSLPGSIMAVSTYALLSYFVTDFSDGVLLIGLILALSHKFLTVGFRSIGDQVKGMPRELDEISQIMAVNFLKKWRDFYFPYLRETLWMALLLILIEVMKEMPLTLMLAPSDFQTLSIKIFNFTSEGEWEKAALPSLSLVVLGFFSVTFLIRHKRWE